ncbi:MAG: hypothetical protein ACRYF2_25965 [Janthinobacterium lividum]
MITVGLTGKSLTPEIAAVMARATFVNSLRVTERQTPVKIRLKISKVVAIFNHYLTFAVHISITES